MIIDELSPADDILRTIIEHSNDLIVVLDECGNRISMSESYRKLFADPGRLVGTGFFQEIDPHDRSMVEHQLSEVFRVGSRIETEFRLTPDGTGTRVLRANCCLLSSRDNKRRIIIIAHDLTDVHQSERKLSLLAQAVICTRDAFVLSDLHNNILFVNPAACEMYGYTEDELVGSNISIVQSSTNPPDVINSILPATLAGGWNGELMNRRKDGTEFPIELWTSVVRNDAGEPVALVGTSRDVSANRQDEKNLRSMTQRMQLVLDNLDVVAFELDANGKFLLSRGRGLEKLGLRPDEVVGLSVYEFYKDYPDILESIRRTFSGVAQQLTIEVGGVIWSTKYVPLRGSDGRVERVFGTAVDITELKRAEEARARESELWHTLMDNIPDTIYFKDTESRFTRINRAQAEVLGIKSVSEAIGKTNADFFSEDHSQRALADEQRIIRTGKPIIGKVERVVAKDGRLHWFSTTKVPIRDSSARIVGIVGSSREITDLKHAEEIESALFRIAETTSTALDMQTLYASIHKIIGELMYARNFYIALYDEVRDLLTFPYFVDEVDKPPSPTAAGRGLTAYVLRTGKSLLCDEKVSDELARRGDAVLVGVPSPIWLGVPLIAGSKTIGVMVVQHYTDPNAYTEREKHILEFVSSQVAKAIEHKRAEEALRQSEEKYRSLFEESQDGIILSTPDGRIIDINPYGVQLFGYDSKEALLKADIAKDLYFNADDRENFKRILARQGYVIDFEIAIKWKDGQTRVVLESASAVRDRDGNIIAYRAYLRDITERKRLEDQLRQAQKMEGIGTLAGGIAHDFNNLLGIILGYASLLEGGTLDKEKTAQSLDTIKKAVQRGADLVRQLLTFARKSDPSFDSIDVNEAIGELAKMLGQTFPKTIGIETDLDPNIPKIIADATQLHQALLNLCVNSRDAIMDEAMGVPGTGKIILKTSVQPGQTIRKKFSTASGSEYVVVSVQDTGIGMDEATRSRIFEPFFTTKGLGKGTGLGLAVVYGVVNSHHAFVNVESEKGVGTTFNLCFPIPTRTVETAGPRPVGDKKSAFEGSETLLLVEDEEMLRELLKSLLEEKGYRVLGARDGQEGIEVYQRHCNEIALVLSDMGLPRLGGWEMFQKMKEINLHVRAILASGYFDPNLKLDMLKAGAKDFIQKPYVAEEVLKRIREVIDGN